MKSPGIAFDPHLIEFANKFFPKNLLKKPQFDGCICDCHPAIYKLLEDAPRDNRFDTSPKSIIESLINDHYLDFIVKVGVWGGMIPGPLGAPFKMIFNVNWKQQPSDCRIEGIKKAVGKVLSKASKNSNLKDSWAVFTEELEWSSVMSSKVLHFIYKAKGFDANLPVPVDNAMCRKWLWPQFQKAVGSKLGSINGDSYNAYCRYLSSIKAWSDVYNWTMSEVECSLFGTWRDNPTIQIF